MALHALRTPAQWAENALRQADVAVLEVVRVFPPIDGTDDDVSEVLYRDERGRPRTAYLKADGTLSLSVAGW